VSSANFACLSFSIACDIIWTVNYARRKTFLSLQTVKNGLSSNSVEVIGLILTSSGF